MMRTLSDDELFQIVHRVSDVYNVRPHMVMGKRRLQPIAEARQMAMAIAYKRIGNLMEVGRLFNRNHSTVTYARAVIKERLSYDRKLNERWRRLCDLAATTHIEDYQI